MRSASLSYVKEARGKKSKPTTMLNEHIQDAKKPVVARYLQLKSGHAGTGVFIC
jgi:hypothetical protein